MKLLKCLGTFRIRVESRDTNPVYNTGEIQDGCVQSRPHEGGAERNKRKVKSGKVMRE